VATTEITESRRDRRQRPRAAPAHYGYQPALDGLRAFAVGSVMLYHASQSWAIGGFLGVDAFFVLSGFLITTLLVTEWGSTRTINLGAFWLRRARRLLPALIVVMVGILFYAAVFAAPAEVEKIRSDGFATLGYSANWKFIFAGQSYFDQFAQPSPFRHMWSLAIEEQFYLIWPLIVFGVLWFTRSVRALLGTALAMMFGSAVLMAVMYSPGRDPSRVYYGTDTRAQSLLMGAVAAILVYLHGPIRTMFMQRALRVLAVIGAGYTLWLWSTLSERSDALYRGGLLLASLAVVIVIVSVTQPDRGLLGRALSWYPLRWIGMISYGLYLWHWPVYLTITGTRTGLEGNALLFARIGVTFAFACLSYYLVELPIRRGTFHIPKPAFTAPALAAALVAGLVLSTSGAGTPPATAAARSIAAGSAAKSSASPSAPSLSVPKPAVSTPAPAESALDLGAPAVEAPPHRASVLMLGDSVAISLGEGLDAVTQENPNLVSINRGSLGCGMLRRGEIATGQQLYEQPGLCDDWNERWLAKLDEFRPDIVMLLTGAWDLLDRRIDGTWYQPGQVGFDRYFLSELDQATQALTSRGSKLVILTTPFFHKPELVGATGQGPPQFDAWRVDRVNALYRDFLVAHPGRYTLIDLNRFVSPGGRYADSIDGVRIRHDDGVHFGFDGAVYVANWLVPQLELVAKLPTSALQGDTEEFDPRHLRPT
jgi:peptidoglycan/LPS O-acetylase OafA/YrhL